MFKLWTVRKLKMCMLFNITIVCIALLSSVAIANDYEDFVQAGWEGNVQEVKRLSGKGIDINTKGNDGFNALMKASYKGNVEVVKFLLEKKADANIKHFTGLTALFAASQQAHLNIVNILLNNDAKVDISLNTGETPLYAASQNGHINIVKLLLKFGANVNAKRDIGVTPIMQASQQGHIDVVRELIKHGADVNIKRNDNTTPLMIAAQEGNAEIVKLLIESGSDVNSKDNKGLTALKVSENEGFKDIIEILKNNAESQKGDSTNVATRSRGPKVTANRLWQCPKCGTILEKGRLGKIWNPGDPIAWVAGNATCDKCMARYDQADVYGGMYDVEEKAKQEGLPGFDGTVSMIAYQLLSTSPPNNAKAICEDLLKKKYPKAKLGKFYCIGRKDNNLTPDEGLVQYKEYVRDGTIPDIGTQFDILQGVDKTGKKAVVLFFKE
jgi:ankyrin repeat protein